MANTIKLRRSATQDAVPTTTQVALGELAMNTYDGKLFMKTDQSGTEAIVTIGSGAVGGGGNAWVVETDQTVTNSYELTAGKNGTTVSPTINSGATVTVPSGATLVIL